MNVLIIYAHPEPRSLNGSLLNFSVGHLEDAGHNVRVSDLYAMKWKAVLDQEDSADWPPDERFDASAASRQAFEAGTQSSDIVLEQEKLKWADAVILQFPLWWFSMPAILKGWVERVYACGLAYGVGEHSDKHWGDRYGEGAMAGKRAMLMVTTGGWESHYGPRGINGAIEDILFPIQHGILYYPGFEVVPPFVIYRTGRTDETRYAQICGALGERLDGLWTVEPIAFRRQNAGDYEIPALTLRSHIAPGRHGFSVHIAKE
jgi:NAD(P)H dehydrogenase (quinone)